MSTGMLDVWGWPQGPKCTLNLSCGARGKGLCAVRQSQRQGEVCRVCLCDRSEPPCSWRRGGPRQLCQQPCVLCSPPLPGSLKIAPWGSADGAEGPEPCCCKHPASPLHGVGGWGHSRAMQHFVTALTPFCPVPTAWDPVSYTSPAPALPCPAGSYGTA